MSRKCKAVAGISAAMAAGVAFAAGGVQGAEWHVRASLTEQFNYDSNIRLSTGSAPDVWGFSTLPSVTIEGHTPRLDVTLDAGLDYTFYEGDDGLNSFDQNGKATVGYKWERARAALAGSVIHAATRTTEILDTGQDFTNAERFIFSGNGSWSYLVSERDSLGVRGSASRSIADTSAIQDYTSYGGGLFWARKLGEVDDLEVSGNYSRFNRTSGLDVESDTYSGRLTYSHQFSQRFRTSLHGGGRYVSTDAKVFDGLNIVSRNETSTGVIAGASVSYLIERGEITGSYERSVEASAVGRLQERDLVSLSGVYRTSPTISLDLKGTFLKQQSVDADVSDGRTYWSTEPGVNWQFYRNLFFRMSYRFRTQKFESLDEWAVSHGAHASLAWRMAPWHPAKGQ